MPNYTEGEFRDLKVVVEAINSVADKGQLIAPPKPAVADEMEVSTSTVTERLDEDFAHACRTAGYVPNRERQSSDLMELYNALRTSGNEVSHKNFDEILDSGTANSHESNIGLIHSQAKEKLGENKSNRYKPRASIVHDIRDEEIVSHHVRGLHHDKVEEYGRTVTDKEIIEMTPQIENKEEAEKMRSRAGVPFQPIEAYLDKVELSGSSEDELLRFWTEEVLDKDWASFVDIGVEEATVRGMTSRVPASDIEALSDFYGCPSRSDNYLDERRYESDRAVEVVNEALEAI